MKKLIGKFMAVVFVAAFIALLIIDMGVKLTIISIGVSSFILGYIFVMVTFLSDDEN